MPLENNKSLLSVKEQMEKMFESMHNLEAGDKNEAFGYLRRCLDVNVKTDEPVIKNLNKRQTRQKHSKLKFKTQSTIPVKRVLKCRICGVKNRTKSLLLKHLESHVGTPISCRNCKRDFNNRPSYQCHISLKMCRKHKTIIRKYFCDQCPKVFKFKRHFEKHVEGHKRNNCTYCDTRLTRRKHLVQHLITVHSIKLERAIMFKCDHCEKRYVKKRSLYHHLKQHAENKIVCMECGFLCSSIEEHEKHFKEHERDRPWKCSKCNDRFLRRQQYLNHMKRHDRYKCVTCNESFASKIRVIRHKQRGHTVEGLEPQMKCPQCPMAFQRRLTLQIHMKKHSDDKVMYCKYCDKNFRSPYLYFKHCASTLHEINAPEKQQLVCEICGKLFVKKYQLEQHLHRVHSQNKPCFKCEYCGHKSTNKPNMDRHLSLHLENKKEVMCEQCGKAFYNLITLKDHIAYVHTEERDFKCDQCDKAFKRNSELVRHKTCHSELRPHVCATCGVAYKRSTHLRRHEESQHGITSKNRRVQRLTTDSSGALVPIPEEKKTKRKAEAVQQQQQQLQHDPQQILSIMDVQFGEMITLALPEVNADFNSINLDQNFTSQLLNDSYSNIINIDETMQQNVAIQNSTTCDILLPENRILSLESSQQSDFQQHPYQYL